MIKPLHDLIVIKEQHEVNETEGGILTVTNVNADRPTSGTILAIGPGLYGDNGERELLQVQVGDVVMYSRETGIDYVDSDHGDIKLIHEAEVIAIVG